MQAEAAEKDGQPEGSDFVSPFQVPTTLSDWVPEKRPASLGLQKSEMLAILNQAAQTMPVATFELTICTYMYRYMKNEAKKCITSNKN